MAHKERCGRSFLYAAVVARRGAARRAHSELLAKPSSRTHLVFVPSPAIVPRCPPLAVAAAAASLLPPTTLHVHPRSPFLAIPADHDSQYAAPSHSGGEPRPEPTAPGDTTGAQLPTQPIDPSMLGLCMHSQAPLQNSRLEEKSSRAPHDARPPVTNVGTMLRESPAPDEPGQVPLRVAAWVRAQCQREQSNAMRHIMMSQPT